MSFQHGFPGSLFLPLWPNSKTPSRSHVPRNGICCASAQSTAFRRLLLALSRKDVYRCTELIHIGYSEISKNISFEKNQKTVKLDTWSKVNKFIFPLLCSFGLPRSAGPLCLQRPMIEVWLCHALVHLRFRGKRLKDGYCEEQRWGPFLKPTGYGI